MKTFTLPGLPLPLHWHIEPPAWRLDRAGDQGDGGEGPVLVVQSGPKTDVFHDPASGTRTANAPCAMMEIHEPNFVLSAHAAFDGTETFDAAVLFVRASEDHWAKFCLENSPARRPTIVSVVTRGVSDDCNSTVLAAPAAHLRLTRTPRTLAFHSSLDGRHWDLVRYFSLGELASLQVGFLAQSPLGAGSEARFSRFAYRTGELANLRDGQ